MIFKDKKEYEKKKKKNRFDSLLEDVALRRLPRMTILSGALSLLAVVTQYPKKRRVGRNGKSSGKIFRARFVVVSLSLFSFPFSLVDEKISVRSSRDFSIAMITFDSSKL